MVTRGVQVFHPCHLCAREGRQLHLTTPLGRNAQTLRRRKANHPGEHCCTTVTTSTVIILVSTAALRYTGGEHCCTTVTTSTALRGCCVCGVSAALYSGRAGVDSGSGSGGDSADSGSGDSVSGSGGDSVTVLAVLAVVVVLTVLAVLIPLLAPKGGVGV